MHAARSLISAVPVALALAVPATAAAAPADLVAHASAATTIKLNSVTSPPRAATAGQRFTLKGTVTNRRTTSQRVTVQVSLRRTKTSSPTRVGTKTLNPIRAGRSAGYSINVKLPSTLAAGTYYVRTCTAYGKRSTVPSTACRFSERRIKVAAAQTGSIQASQAPATAGATTPTTPASPAPTAPPAQGIDVLIFHKGAAPDAIDAVTAAAEANDYDVDVTEISENFTETNLKRYQTVVFLNTSGDVLNAAQQSAFEAYHKAGGGFLALGSAIGTEPGWAYMDSLLGTRAATGPVSGRVRATIKVADRVHDASKTLPEYWRLTDAVLQLRRQRPRPGPRPRDRRRDDVQRRHDGLRPPDHVVQGRLRRPRVLLRRRQHARGAHRRPPDRPPERRARLDVRPLRPGVQRLRRHRAGQLPADQAQRAAERQRADRLRPAAGRPHHPDHP